MSDSRKILNSFDRILKVNKNLVNEVAASSTDLFGGKTVKIPKAGEHGSQSGWQSANAWDIPAPIGTPVYAIADGTALTFRDYGRNIIATGGKKLYGQSFTVKSDGNIPDVYYTHLEGSPIQKGSKIECGQFLGYVMDMPGSSYDHVHVGVEKGDISQFLTPDGKLKCGGGTITGEYQGSEPTQSTDDSSDDSISGTTIGGYGTQIKNKGKEDIALFQAAKRLGSMLGLTEATFSAPLDKMPEKIYFPFGEKRKTETHPGVDLSTPSGTPVKSPMDGEVVNVNNNAPKCGGTIDIDYKNGFWSRFCHIKRIDVQKGDIVKQGQVVGLSGGALTDPQRGNSQGPHLHFTLKKDGKLVDPMDYISKTVDGSTIIPTMDSDDDDSNDSITGTTVGGYGRQTKNKSKEDVFLFQAAKRLGQALGLSEGFGKNTKKEYGKILIPGSSNKKIFSPVDGVINNTKFDSSCRNQIMIEFGDSSSFLKYCGVTDRKVKNGQKVSEGQLIGTMSEEDVAEVIFLDSSYQKQNIDTSIVTKKTKEKTSSKQSKGPDRRTYYDPALAGLMLLPKKIFGNVYDKDTGELKVKKWKDWDDSRDVDPWIANAVKKPFQKKTTDKKIQENIKRIKGLL